MPSSGYTRYNPFPKVARTKSNGDSSVYSGSIVSSISSDVGAVFGGVVVHEKRERIRDTINNKIIVFFIFSFFQDTPET